jgi:hypothetical protein
VLPCATASSSATSSTASIPGLFPRCVSDLTSNKIEEKVTLNFTNAQRIWGENDTKIYCLLSCVARWWRTPSSQFRHSMGLRSLPSSTSRT